MNQIINVKRNRRRRKIKDGIANFFTYLASGIATAVLVAVFIFVLTRGLKVLSWDMIRDNYWSENLLAAFPQENIDHFTRPHDLPEGSVFSSKYGFAVADRTNQQKQRLIEVTYVDPDSIMNQAKITTKGERFDQPVGNMIGNNLTRVQIEIDGNLKNIGSQARMDATTFIEQVEQSSQMKTMFYQSRGGGIWGSLIATLMLILLSLLISIPIGIASAVYLHEYAKPNKITSFMRQSIEMLSGVPSIIFGLMGVAVLFPITALFGANSLSIFLGAITMSVMLLPIVIRQTEESLIVVPVGLRNASLSLGATETQTIFKVVLPAALPGIISAILLAVSRVIGESAALIYTMGTTISDNPKFLQPATTLSVQIWSIMSGEQPNFELASAISIIILVVVLGLNLIVKLITNHLNRKWEM